MCTDTAERSGRRNWCHNGRFRLLRGDVFHGRRSEVRLADVYSELVLEGQCDGIWDPSATVLRLGDKRLPKDGVVQHLPASAQAGMSRRGNMQPRKYRNQHPVLHAPQRGYHQSTSLMVLRGLWAQRKLIGWSTRVGLVNLLFSMFVRCAVALLTLWLSAEQGGSRTFLVVIECRLLWHLCEWSSK